ncbi:uracil-DNA glycosylase [Jongsikchunia kroppenstedtii]|uniref:uracil-DNA glycosylase n=1 Tax=Jongsikchunia kroppenstedtii TaxID=1121721 RepID=UPI00036A6417|nr:uracil-DNA glycosylase [Jongsikchunia kroppenstedtii]
MTGNLFVSPVPPGTGWPDAPATPSTRSADDAADVTTWAAQAATLDELSAEVSVCRACPRLTAWRETVALEKRRAFADQPYWGRPIPGWGDPHPRLLLMGLAPAANGANRTGRIFTGDRSGDWLFASLHRTGLATRHSSEHAGDGQQLLSTRILCTVRCAPPDNKPTVAERATCAPWLLAEWRLVMPTVRVVLALGTYGWDASLRTARELGYGVPSPKPRFGHGAHAELRTPEGEPVTLLGCYHPSQQNTSTGRLTTVMLDTVMARAGDLAGLR